MSSFRFVLPALLCLLSACGPNGEGRFSGVIERSDDEALFFEEVQGDVVVSYSLNYWEGSFGQEDLILWIETAAGDAWGAEDQSRCEVDPMGEIYHLACEPFGESFQTELRIYKGGRDYELAVPTTLGVDFIQSSDRSLMLRFEAEYTRVDVENDMYGDPAPVWSAGEKPVDYRIQSGILVYEDR